jgi:hypothetical protein
MLGTANRHGRPARILAVELQMIAAQALAVASSPLYSP